MEGFKNTMKLVFFTILIGSFFGMLIHNHYLDDVFAFQDINVFYFLQEGTYSSRELVRANTRNLNTKLVVEDNGMYHVYVAITRDVSVRDYIIELYQEKDIEIHSKEKVFNHLEFQTNIDQFDLLLRNSTTIEEINSISAVVLSNFEQTIRKD